jgi:hypothetical protein
MISKRVVTLFSTLGRQRLHRTIRKKRSGRTPTPLSSSGNMRPKAEFRAICRRPIGSEGLLSSCEKEGESGGYKRLPLCGLFGINQRLDRDSHSPSGVSAAPSDDPERSSWPKSYAPPFRAAGMSLASTTHQCAKKCLIRLVKLFWSRTLWAYLSISEQEK